LLMDAGETPRQKERYIFRQNLLRKIKYRGKVDQRTLSISGSRFNRKYRPGNGTITVLSMILTIPTRLLKISRLSGFVAAKSVGAWLPKPTGGSSTASLTMT
jgi:hypothetical protein